MKHQCAGGPGSASSAPDDPAERASPPTLALARVAIRRSDSSVLQHGSGRRRIKRRYDRPLMEIFE